MLELVNYKNDNCHFYQRNKLIHANLYQFYIE
jgi:hypothetical protein